MISAASDSSSIRSHVRVITHMPAEFSQSVPLQFSVDFHFQSQIDQDGALSLNFGMLF